MSGAPQLILDMARAALGVVVGVIAVDLAFFYEDRVNWPILLVALVGFLLAADGAIGVRSGARAMMRTIYLFENGFVAAHGRRLAVYPWSEVEITQRHVRRRIGGRSLRSFRCWVSLSGQQSFDIHSDHSKHADELVQIIERETARARLPTAAAQLSAGEDVAFGPLTLASTALSDDRQTLSWHDVQDLAVVDGNLRVTSSTGSLALPVSRIPNFSVFWALAKACHDDARPPDSSGRWAVSPRKACQMSIGDGPPTSEQFAAWLAHPLTRDIVVLPNAVGLRAIRADTIVDVVLSDEQPMLRAYGSDPASGWETAAEASIDCRTGYLTLSTLDAELLRLKVSPTTYRVRAHTRQMHGRNLFQLAVWPAPLSEPRVVKSDA